MLLFIVLVVVLGVKEDANVRGEGELVVAFVFVFVFGVVVDDERS